MIPKRKIQTVLLFETIKIFSRGSKKQEGKCWVILYKAVQVLLNYALYYLKLAVQQKYFLKSMDSPELLQRMVLHILTWVEFRSGTETHKGVSFLFIYYVSFFPYLYLLARQVFPQALTSFIYYSFSSRKRNLKYLSTGYYFLKILSTSAKYAKWLNPFWNSQHDYLLWNFILKRLNN